MFGGAGTGKSAVITEMVRRITEAFDKYAVAVVAPTGIAAANVNGATAHSTLRFNDNTKCGNYNGTNKAPYQTCRPLSGVAQGNFQDKHSKLRFLILDECSMVGSRMLNYIEQRCRETRQEHLHGQESSKQIFGGLMIWIFGDYHQLPPVMGTPLFYDYQPSDVCIKGKLIFEKFSSVFMLNTNHRQADPDSANFRQMLGRIATGDATEDDLALLKTRHYVNLSQDERNRFEGLDGNGKPVIQIFCTNKEVYEANKAALIKLGSPVTIVMAQDRRAGGGIRRTRYVTSRIVCADHEVKGGLITKLHLAKNCRVMLRSNILVSYGLANGTIGTVRGIECSGQNQMPTCVYVEFDNYNGPKFPDNRSSLFPIVPITFQSMDSHNIPMFRTQLPLTLAYATTIHKSQGLSLNEAVIDLSSPEKQIGLAYTAFSRVRRLSGLMIKGTLTLPRVNGARCNATIFNQRQAFIAKLEQLHATP